jgi:hypothetical protein
MALHHLKKLYNALEVMHGRSNIATSPQDFFHVLCGEFTKELATNPAFHNFLKMVAEQMKKDLEPYYQHMVAAWQEINTTRTLFSQYSAFVPELVEILADCDDLEKSHPPMSYELFLAIVTALQCACLLILSDSDQKHHNILAGLVRLNDKNRITEYIFAPSLQKLSALQKILKRNQETALWYSVDMIMQLFYCYDLEGRSQIEHALRDTNQWINLRYFQFDAQNLDKILEHPKLYADLADKHDVEKYRIHYHRVWEAAKQDLLITMQPLKKASKLSISRQNNLKTNTALPKARSISYLYTDVDDFRKGTITNAATVWKTRGESAELLYVIAHRKKVHKDKINKYISGSPLSANQIKNALRVINTNMRKFGCVEKFILLDKNGFFTINKLYRQCFYLKNNS